MSDVAQGVLTVQNIQERVLYLLAFTHEFVTWPLWPLTAFYAVGFVSLFLRLVRKHPVSGDRVALSLYALVLCVWFVTSIMSHIQRDRCLFAILPFFLLLALREFFLLVKTVLVSTRWFRRSSDFGISTLVSLA